LIAVVKRPVDPAFAAGFGLVVALLVVLAGITYWNTSRLIDAATSVEHTRMVLGELDSLFSAMRDAEAGERGYVITGLPSYLDPYKAALTSVPPALGKARMDTIRSLVAEMQREERGLLSERTSNTTSLARTAIVTLSLGGLLTFAFLGVIWLLLRRDLLRRQETEDELRRLASIVASSEDAIIGESLLGHVTEWNAAAERLFGYTKAEMLGRSVSILEPPGLEGNTAVTLQKIHRGERVLQFDTTRIRKDGTVIPVSVSVSPIRDATDRLIGASKIVRDIRERKEAERQLRLAKEAAEEASLAKDRFLAVLSHELRTPLTPVLLTAQALEKRELPADLRRAIELIRRNVDLEALLVDDLLDVTRITHGKLELRRQPVDLHELTENAVEICRGDALARRQTLSLQLEAREHFAEADPARMQQVFWNLVQNAVKFTDEGGTVRVASDNPGPGTIRIRVSDTGRGIAPESLERVFDPFEQEGGSGHLSHKGLGLGLAISRALIELHGGAIRAESAGTGLGATFTVTLPAHLEKRMARAPGGESGASPRRPLTILLAEDHADTAEALSRLLADEGHRILPASSLEEAVAVGRREHVDLLITDLGLPDGSGHELLGRLREFRPVQGIVLSGYGMDGDVAKSREAGFLDHLTKPVNVERLLRVIERFALRL
jgi:PAS domain S-box-containing protein